MYMQKLTQQIPYPEKQQAGTFNSVKLNVLKIQEGWNDFYQQFSEVGTPYSVEFQQHNRDLSQAVDKILRAIETPTLTLATTGTTSSGKSTLVNLLCGADIMPRMAGEMSAGIVTIKHASDGKRWLKIEKTGNATWECGEWNGLSDDDIRIRLTKTMDAFNEAKKTRELPSPVIELSYPIACFFPNAGMLDLSDLPAHTQFQIMDLPGKRNQDDKINSAVIENCRRALSIVTYNMEQTDEKLRQSLMEEVLGQVKLMGGSPARMLFALNRIDVFRKDQDWERREQETAEQTIKEIKAILSDRLPEHRHVLEHLSYSKLSSLPALLAWQMKTSEGEKRIKAGEAIDTNFGNMITKVVREDLPRSAKKWENIEFQKVQDSVWDSSYAKDFFPMLEKHIRENFAKLIVAPLLVEFEGVISKIIGQADRTCMIEVESSHTQLADIRKQLEEDKNAIQCVLNDYCQDLMSLPSVIEKSTNLESLYNSNEELGNLYNHEDIKGSILPAFSKSVAEPIQWVSGVSEGVTQSLNSDSINFLGTTAAALSQAHTNRLTSICRNLTKNIYKNDIYDELDCEINDECCKIKAVSDEEKGKLDSILDDLQRHLSDLSLLMQDVYKDKVDSEKNRIKELIEKILSIFISSLNDAIKLQGFMLTLRFDESIHANINLDMASIEFDIAFGTEEKTERDPWLLWLGTRNVNYGEIPSPDYLHRMITSHLASIRNTAAKPLREAISKYYNEVAAKMDDYLESIIEDVNAKLANKLNEGKAKQKEEEQLWLEMRESITFISSQMQQLLMHKV